MFEELMRLNDDELEKQQISGAGLYMSAYILRMGRALGVDTTDKDELTAFVLDMLVSLNTATEATWRAMMGDDKWVLAYQKMAKELHDLYMAVHDGK